VERSWRVAGTAVELRTVLIPICAGTGAIVFIQAHRSLAAPEQT